MTTRAGMVRAALLLCAVCVLLLGVTAAGAKPPRQQAQNTLMKGHALLLRSYIEDYARAHDGLYPPVGDVAKGEGLDEPL